MELEGLEEKLNHKLKQMEERNEGALDKFERTFVEELKRIELELDCNKRKTNEMKISVTKLEGECVLIKERIDNNSNLFKEFKGLQEKDHREVFERLNSAESLLASLKTALSNIIPAPAAAVNLQSLLWDIVKMIVVALFALKIAGKL